MNWLIMSSGTNTFKQIPFGRTGVAGTTDRYFFPSADFNGDGRDELVFVNRNLPGGTVNYYVGDSNTGAGIITKSFGNYNSDFSIPPADYTGDGRADFVAVRRTQGAPLIWYINNSVTNATTATVFGDSPISIDNADLPVRGDYDGDRRHDIAVYRQSNRTFYYISSFNDSIQGQEAGLLGEFPLGFYNVY